MVKKYKTSEFFFFLLIMLSLQQPKKLLSGRNVGTVPFAKISNGVRLFSVGPSMESLLLVAG